MLKIFTDFVIGVYKSHPLFKDLILGLKNASYMRVNTVLKKGQNSVKNNSQILKKQCLDSHLKSLCAKFQGPMSNGPLASSKINSEKKKGNNSWKMDFFKIFEKFIFEGH